jgi:large subunit ribosomal protein L25
MAIVPLTGSLRERSGKGPARQARLAGRIPAILYGHGQAALSVAVETRDFINAMRQIEGGNMIVSLKLDGGERTALVREVQRDPLTHEILHLDFQEVSLTEKVRVEVNVRLVGSPAGVKEGGILEPITRQVEVECLATAIPDGLDVDVSALGIGDSVHVRDLQSLGIVILTDPDQTVATVVPPTVYEAPVAAEAAVAAPTAEEPEVIGKGKEEGEEKPEEEKK